MQYLMHTDTNKMDTLTQNRLILCFRNINLSHKSRNYRDTINPRLVINIS